MMSLRFNGRSGSIIKVGRMAIDLNARTVAIDGKPLSVTPKEYSILELLALCSNGTMTKPDFLDHLYLNEDVPEQKTIDVVICKLRKKIRLIEDNNSTRLGSRSLFAVAEFILPRAEAEEWLDNAEVYYEGYAKRTSELRAKTKLTFEVMGLAFSRLWKPLAAAIGIPKIYSLVSRLLE